MSKQLTPGITFVMAAATGLSVANVYYIQPMLGLILSEFSSNSNIALTPSTTLLGFALGLVFLVPLGDTTDRRKLILWQALGLFLSLTAAAIAPTPALLILATVAIGINATIAQQIIPFASDLAPNQSRGRVVGTIMSGLLIGILLARTLSGFVGEFFGWRIMFGLGSLIALGMAALLALYLPRSVPKQKHRYPELMKSLPGLARSYPELRYATLVQGFLFAGFSAFWTILALLLQTPKFGLGSHIAGLFGIIGIVGILVSPFAGRFADKHGPYAIISLGILTVMAGFIVFTASVNIAGLAAGAILLDAGLMMAMVSNQTIIFSLDPTARSRINTIYMTGLFVAGAAGSALSSIVWIHYSWHGVTTMGILFASLSLYAHIMGQRDAKLRSMF